MNLDDLLALAALRHAANTAQEVAARLGEIAPGHADGLKNSAQEISDAVDAHILETVRGARRNPDPPTS